MANDLNAALLRASPRHSPRPVPLPSLILHGLVLALWISVVLGSTYFHGLLAWSVGLLYAGYDTCLLLFVAQRTRTLSPTPVPAPSEDERLDPLRVGILIAARNEERSIGRTLDALLGQVRSTDTILVIDDGSTDGTVAVLAARYGVLFPPADALGCSLSHPTLKVLCLPHGGKAAALNAGLARLGSEVVLTVDADTLLEAGAVEGMRRAFQRDPQLVAAGGVLTPVCEPRGAGRLFQWFQTYEYIRAFIARAAWMRSGALLLVSGAFAGFRRRAVCEIGGFDAACLVEDYELIHRLHRFAHERGLSWHVAVLSEARAVTDTPGSLLAFLRQRRRWFAGFLQTQYWNRDMTGNPRFGALGKVMLPIKAVDTLQPVYGISAFVLLLWFLLSGRPVLRPVLLVIGVKIVIDLCFHLWSLRLYARWVGRPIPRSRFALAVVAAVLEPFSFQLLRHSGAVWGWLSFLSGRLSWGKSS